MSVDLSFVSIYDDVRRKGKEVGNGEECRVLAGDTCTTYIIRLACLIFQTTLTYSKLGGYMPIMENQFDCVREVSLLLENISVCPDSISFD
jgi:hypothetical protein